MKYPTPVIKKKYRQLKFTDACRSGEIRIQNSGTQVQRIRNEAPLIEKVNKQGSDELQTHIQNEIGYNEVILEVQETKQLDQEVGSDHSFPKQNWFKRILGSWKCNEDHIKNTMEEIVFVEDMLNMESCTPVLMEGHGKVIEFETQAESEGSRSSIISMVFESIGGNNSNKSDSTTNEALEENFEDYFKRKCKTKNHCIQEIIASPNNNAKVVVQKTNLPLWKNEALSQSSLEEKFRCNVQSMSNTWRPSQSNSECKEEYVCRRIGRGNSRIAKLLVEGSLYEGSSITSLSDNEITFFPEDEIVEEKKESEKWNFRITNMEMLNKQNLSSGGAFHKPSAFKEKIKQRNGEESQIIGEYCDVCLYGHTDQNGTNSQYRDSKLRGNSSSKQKKSSFSVQAQATINKQYNLPPEHKETNINTGVRTAKQMQTLVQPSDEANRRTHNSNQEKHKQIENNYLSADLCEKSYKSKLMVELTDAKVNTREPFRMEGNGKISQVSNEDLIGRNNVKNLMKMDLKQIGGDIRKWMTSKRIKKKKSGCAKFYPIFRKKNNVES